MHNKSISSKQNIKGKFEITFLTAPFPPNTHQSSAESNHTFIFSPA